MTSKDQKNPEEQKYTMVHFVDGIPHIHIYYSKIVPEPQPDAAEKDPWELEEGFPSDWIPTPNITPDVPNEKRNDYVWPAIRWAMLIAENEEHIYTLVEEWNMKNDSRIPDRELRKMIHWAINKWDTKFNPRYTQ